MKHTPGPWTAIDSIVVTTFETHGFATWLANCAVGGESLDQKLANARLVATAPELLTALQETLALLETFSPQGAAVDKARAVIAKATGEKP